MVGKTAMPTTPRAAPAPAASSATPPAPTPARPSRFISGLECPLPVRPHPALALRNTSDSRLSLPIPPVTRRNASSVPSEARRTCQLH